MTAWLSSTPNGWLVCPRSLTEVHGRVTITTDPTWVPAPGYMSLATAMQGSLEFRVLCMRPKSFGVFIVPARRSLSQHFLSLVNSSGTDWSRALAPNASSQIGPHFNLIDPSHSVTAAASKPASLTGTSVVRRGESRRIRARTRRMLQSWNLQPQQRNVHLSAWLHRRRVSGGYGEPRNHVYTE